MVSVFKIVTILVGDTLNARRPSMTIIGKNSETQVLVVGASYGLLIASLFLVRNIKVTIFCFDEEARSIYDGGLSVGVSDPNSPGFYREAQVPIENLKLVTNSSELIAELDVIDVMFLAVSEPYLYGPDLSSILLAANAFNVPRVSLMNIPTPSFLCKRFSFDQDEIKSSYLDYQQLLRLLPEELTMICNPEPQVFRPGAALNTIQVRLGGTFRVCRSSAGDSSLVLDSLLQNMAEHDPVAALPASIKSYDSTFIGLSKLPMLMAGNYRCFDGQGRLISIFEAVSTDLSLSEAIYESVLDLLRFMGARRSELIPFRLYVKASSKLTAPSSICRAVYQGAAWVERADRLVHSLMMSFGCDELLIDEIVRNIDFQIKSRKNLSSIRTN